MRFRASVVFGPVSRSSFLSLYIIRIFFFSFFFFHISQILTTDILAQFRLFSLCIHIPVTRGRRFLFWSSSSWTKKEENWDCGVCLVLLCCRKFESLKETHYVLCLFREITIEWLILTVNLFLSLLIQFSMHEHVQFGLHDARTQWFEVNNMFIPPVRY